MKQFFQGSVIFGVSKISCGSHGRMIAFGEPEIQEAGDTNFAFGKIFVRNIPPLGKDSRPASKFVREAYLALGERCCFNRRDGFWARFRERFKIMGIDMVGIV